MLTFRRARTAVLLVSAATIVGLACDTPTEPSRPFEARLSALGEPSVTLDSIEAGAYVIRCTVRLVASVEGSGVARWTRFVFRRTRGINGSPLTDSVSFEYTESSRPFFVRDSLSRLRPDTAEILLGSDVPFSSVLEFYYQLPGESAPRMLPHTFVCGPTLAPAAAPPTVQLLSVNPPRVPLAVGDTISVRYRVQAGGPIWRTRIELLGAFGGIRQVFERLQTDRENVERFVVPAHTPNGQRLALRLRVFDMIGRVGLDSVSTDLLVAPVP
jgi:hypothetical protein